jgi:lipoyl(octanoyl) transferase
VITTGRRAVDGLPHDGIEIVHTERGGLATWHGPGQLVGYILVNIRARGGSVKGTVCAVEEAVIRWLGDQGVQAMRRTGYPGVWVGHAKLCAVGMHFRRGVSMHGFALNLCPDLRVYDRFVPCGIVDGSVTSLQALQHRAIPPHQAADQVGRHLVDTLNLGG